MYIYQINMARVKIKIVISLKLSCLFNLKNSLIDSYLYIKLIPLLCRFRQTYQRRLYQRIPRLDIVYICLLQMTRMIVMCIPLLKMYHKGLKSQNIDFVSRSQLIMKTLQICKYFMYTLPYLFFKSVDISEFVDHRCLNFI